jgi:hypothetical protein
MDPQSTIPPPPPASTAIPPESTEHPETLQYQTTRLQSTLADGRTARPWATDLPETGRPYRSTVPPRATIGLSEVPGEEATDPAEESGNPAGQTASDESSTGLLVGCIVMLLVMCAIYGFMMYRESVRKGQKLVLLGQPRDRASRSVPV